MQLLGNYEVFIYSTI